MLLVPYLAITLLLTYITWTPHEPRPLSVLAVSLGWPILAVAALASIALLALAGPSRGPYEDGE